MYKKARGVKSTSIWSIQVTIQGVARSKQFYSKITNRIFFVYVRYNQPNSIEKTKMPKSYCSST